MPVAFEVYAPDGTLQLSTATKPIGRDNKVKLLTSPTFSTWGQYYVDPQTLKQTFFPQVRNYSDYDLPDNHMYFLQLNDGASMITSPTLMTAVGLLETVGKVLLSDMREFNPVPQVGEHLQVFDATGKMLWGSESLASSVQLIKQVDIPLGTMTYATQTPLYFDLPAGVDLGKVFFYPIIPNVTPYPNEPSPDSISQWHLLYFKRVGNRVYILPDFYIYFMEDMYFSRDGRTTKLVDCVGSPNLSIWIVYIPNLPS